MTASQTWLRRLSLLGGIFALSACMSVTQNRFISQPSKPQELNLRAGNPSDLVVTLEHIISPGGAGTWLADTEFNEFRINYSSGQEIFLESIRIIDLQGRYVFPERPIAFRSASKLGEAMHNNQLKNLGLGAAAAVADGLSGIPIFGLAYGAYGITTPGMHVSEAKETELIEAELKKRQLNLPMQVTRGASISGSHFFPVALQPKTIVVTYKNSISDLTERELRIDLDGLKTLFQPK